MTRQRQKQQDRRQNQQHPLQLNNNIFRSSLTKAHFEKFVLLIIITVQQINISTVHKIIRKHITEIMNPQQEAIFGGC